MYAVLYPHVTLLMRFPLRCLCLHYCLFGIPAWLAFLLWALFQLAMAGLTHNSIGGGTAYVAHLGGAIPGLICGFIMRYLRARRAEELEN